MNGPFFIVLETSPRLNDFADAILARSYWRLSALRRSVPSAGAFETMPLAPLTSPVGCGNMPAAGRLPSSAGAEVGVEIRLAVAIESNCCVRLISIATLPSPCANDAPANEAAPINADAARIHSFISNSLGSDRRGDPGLCRGCGMHLGLPKVKVRRPQVKRTVDPVVLRASRSSCALRVSFSA